MATIQSDKAKNKNKISFFGALLIVFGALIGAGIFFKSKSVLEGSGFNLALAIASWIVACISIIAMSFSLIEIASVSSKSNLSLIIWNKIFNSKFVYQLSKSFIIYAYLPFTYFVMPVYFMQMLQDAIAAFKLSESASWGLNFDWIIVLLVTLVVFYYFLVVGLNSKIAQKHNTVILFFKFIPIISTVILGFVFLAMGASNQLASQPQFSNISNTITQGESLAKTLPGVGILLSMAAIFFTYEGFFTVAGLQTEMKNPKKTPLAIMIGIALTTIIYLLIAIATSIVGDGSISSFLQIAKDELKWSQQVIQWIIGTTNLFIAISILGIVNVFTMWGPRAIDELIKNGELKFLEKWHQKYNQKTDKPIVASWFLAIISTVLIIILTLVGVYGYSDNTYSLYGESLNNLYAFADISGNWSALITFALIAASIYGGIQNRKTNLITTQKIKYFKPLAYFSVISIVIILSSAFLIPIIDLFLLTGVDPNVENFNLILKVRITKIIVLILFVFLPSLPAFYEKFKDKKLLSIR
ncbi:Serine/threonine exchanger SteT [Mesomycoplasma conjunctivae]|uniref:Amino acid permease n=1 Tax=Mesomycoplasma conjunctivae (strain ATCC 25834 / NCTC 10147 / HRC/581) TaxID=572263 RepID=C5J6B7_MESCH|nr:APC family permease [Mesomycoplasma conjunctivae]CAT05009.1 Amino acid permease [Mesomycoplasma conjunctivae]VEU66332.1 Serine/threonine exchanger SteT [Mesomycoplasma conjunctivae]